MASKPVAAGKSSLDLIDQDIAFAHIISEPGSIYLDLACGTGRYSVSLAKRLHDDGAIHAFDLWKEGISALIENADTNGLTSIQAKVADITQKFPLNGESVDVCFIATALHDISTDARNSLIDEVRRVLIPDGTFIIIEFKKIDHGPGPEISNRIGENDADNLLIPQGFQKEVTVSLGEYAYLSKYTKV
jgi:ubiquinone/menaquinone biosynthesis C-methylase UbiE